MQTVAQYSQVEVFAAMDAFPRQRKAVLSDGNSFKRVSQRLMLFRDNCFCVDCGIEGTVFLLQKRFRDDSPHMNLYAVDGSGKLILMTKDHVLPKSRGGRDVMENYQTMCQICNTRKGSQLEEERNANALISA